MHRSIVPPQILRIPSLHLGLAAATLLSLALAAVLLRFVNSFSMTALFQSLLKGSGVLAPPQQDLVVLTQGNAHAPGLVAQLGYLPVCLVPTQFFPLHSNLATCPSESKYMPIPETTKF